MPGKLVRASTRQRTAPDRELPRLAPIDIWMNQKRRCRDALLPPDYAPRDSVGTAHWLYFSCALVSGSRVGNLPKREARLLLSETRRIFYFRPNDGAVILRCGSVLERALTSRPGVEVPLDGAATKSEDYQMDAGTHADQAAMIALN